MANIVDEIDGETVVGSVGKQKDVHTAQAKAFQDNAVTALAELYTNIWSVQRSTDDGMEVPDELTNAKISTQLIATLAQVNG